MATTFELRTHPTSKKEDIICRVKKLYIGIEAVEQGRYYQVMDNKFTYLVIYRGRKEQFGLKMTVMTDVPVHISSMWSEDLLMEAFKFYAKEKELQLNMVRNTGSGKFLFEDNLLYNDEPEDTDPVLRCDDPGDF